MEISVLGISGSPVRSGNAESFLQAALEAAAEAGGVTTKLISLAGKDIRDCTQCNWCAAHQEEGRPCKQDDDMTAIYPDLLKADVILISTPVYFGRMTGVLACFIDRLRCFYSGKIYTGKLANKVGGALAVSWYRNRGNETTLTSLVSTVMALSMVPVSPPKLGSVFGAAGVSSEHGTGEFDRADRKGILRDKHGLEGARTMAQRAVEVARIIKAGQECLKAGPGV